MNTLPTEIIDCLSKFLEKKDIINCLTVNKHCYSIFIKYIYKEISIGWTHTLDQFMDAFACSPRMKEAGKYVQKFSSISEGTFDDYTLEYREEEFLDILVHLPNIEEFTICPTYSLLELLTKTTKPIFPNIKILNLNVMRSFYLTYLMDCFYRFRSTLTTISNYYADYLPCDASSDKLVTYFGAFPRLNSITIGSLGINSVPDDMIFTDLLEVCPVLTHLVFVCPAININDLCAQKSFPQLKHLELDTCQLNFDTARSLKNVCPQLKSLRLKLGDVDQQSLADILSWTKSIDKLVINSTKSNYMNIIDDFVRVQKKRSEDRHESVINIASFGSPSDRKYSFELSADYNPHTNIKTIKLQVARLGLFVFKYYPILERIGSTLNKLEISVHGFELQHINQECPLLSELVLRSLTATTKTSEQPVINKHLTRVTIDDIYPTYSKFKEIVECCPNIQHLYLSNFNEPDKEIAVMDQDVVYYIEIPVTSLKINISKEGHGEQNIAVVKALDGVWIKSWRYCSQIRGMVVTEDPLTISDIGPSMASPLYVLICNSVKHVSFTKEQRKIYW
ncbi:hypothetical protein BDB01DRAFT_347997 [Pilobolus umbonatus]|nr:hypothetical protein BDB01DRAFT_347997 [Pilobolus umbonatus]